MPKHPIVKKLVKKIVKKVVKKVVKKSHFTSVDLKHRHLYIEGDVYTNIVANHKHKVVGLVALPGKDKKNKHTHIILK